MAKSRIGTAILELATESGAFFRDLDKVDARANGLDKSWRDAGKSLQTYGRQTADVGTALSKMSLPLIAIGAGVTKVAVDFESSFAGVRKTVDATEPEFAALAQGFRDLSKSIPINVNELNRLGEAAGALGIPKGEIVDFARVMALLGVTTNVTSDQAAESIAKIQNIFGAAGKDTERFASTLVALGNDGASTEDQILSLANRIASAGNAVGLSQGQVLGYASAIANVGIEAEAGGSAMSKTLIEISQAVSKGGADLAAFAKVAGVSSAVFAKAFKEDAADATRMFIEGLGRIKAEGGDLNTVIESLGVKEIRQSNLLRSLALSGDNVAKSLKIQSQAWQENSALSAEAGKRFETVSSQATLLWNRVQDVALIFGEALMPAMKTAMSVIGGLVPLLEWMAKTFASLPGFIQFGVIGLVGLAAAAGPVVFVVGSLITNVGILTKGLWTLGNTIPMLTARIWLMEASAGALGTTMAIVGKGIAVVAVGFAAWQIGRWIGEWTGATDVIGRFSARLGELIGLLPKGASEQYKAMRAAERAAEAAKGQAKALDETADAMKGVGQYAEKLGPHLDQATGAIGRTEEELKEAKKSADDFQKSLRGLGAADALAGAREVVKQLNALNGPLNVLPGKLGEMAARLREGAQAALLKGHSTLARDYSLLADTLDPLIQFQQRYNVTIGEYATDAKKAGDFTQDLWEQIHRLKGEVQTVGPVLKSSMDLKKLFVGFADTRLLQENLPDSQQWTQAWSTMRTGLVNNLAQIPDTLARAFEGGGDIWGAVKSIGSQIGSGIGGAIGFGLGGPGGQAIGSAIGSMVGPAMEGFKKLFGIGVNEAVKKVNAEIGELRNKLLDTHGPLEQLEAKANRVGLSFEANWGHQGQAGLKAMNALIAEFDRRLAAVAAASAQAVSSFAAVATGMTGPWLAVGDRVKTTGEELDKAREALTKFSDADQSEQHTQALEAYNLALAASKQALDAQAGAAQLGKQQLADLGAQAVGTFAAAIASGMTWSEAIKAVGPSLVPIADSYKALGLDVEDVGLKQLLLSARVAETNPQLLGAAAAHGQSLQALAQFGLLNVERFAAMQRTGTELHTRLQAEFAGTEEGSRLALLPMQDYLHQAKVQSELLNIPLEAGTQELIDQSIELGIWKETGASAQDKLIAGMDALIVKVSALIDQFLGVSNAIGAIPAHKTITIEAQYYDPGAPEDFGQGTIGGVPVLPMAEGGMGHVTGPTLFLAGEAGSEDFAFSGGGRRFGDGGGSADSGLLKELAGLRRDLATIIPSMVESAARHGAQTAGRRL
ncbi:MAG: phage tail tape measure protein [Acidobacteriota bacterium]|nr:phage tail tape measure protein [Acidobacteriota bacterium]